MKYLFYFCSYLFNFSCIYEHEYFSCIAENASLYITIRCSWISKTFTWKVSKLTSFQNQFFSAMSLLTDTINIFIGKTASDRYRIASDLWKLFKFKMSISEKACWRNFLVFHLQNFLIDQDLLNTWKLNSSNSHTVVEWLLIISSHIFWNFKNLNAKIDHNYVFLGLSQIQSSLCIFKILI